MPTQDAATAEVEAIKSDLAALRDDMSALSRSIFRGGARQARAARDAVEQQLTDAKEAAEGFVQDRPFCTLALAFGAGAVVGRLLFRR